MNLHLAQDEKFIDFVINDVRLLNLSGENHFCIYTDHDRELKFVKSRDVWRLKMDSPQWEELFSAKIYQYSRVFIHYLDPPLYDLIIKLPPQITLVWCFFGHDGFSLFPRSSFLQPLSKKYLFKTSFSESLQNHGVLYYLLYPLFQWHRKRFVDRRNQRLIKAICRINYFGHFIQEDFNMIKLATSSAMRFLPFTFNALDTLQYDEDTTNVGPNILIGNSATITNNHFEVMERLRGMDLGERKIYCPLSYGDTKYAKEVERFGRSIFGANFVALTSFMPLVEYKRILHSCGFVFMNHDRSQASDNVLINLSSGAKVFMSQNSSLYAFLKSLGVVLFTIQRDVNSLSLSSGLTATQQKENKEKISSYFGKIAHEDRLKRVLSI